MENWNFEHEQDLCVRVGIAAKNLFTVVASINRKLTKSPSFNYEDTSITFKMKLSHPKLQCRLDTALAAAIQQKRPLCWYRPLSDELLSKKELLKDAVENFADYIGEGNLEKIGLAQTSSLFNINQKNQLGKTPFFMAVENGRINLIKFLLTFNGIELHQTSNKDELAINKALDNLHFKTVKYLLRDLEFDVNQNTYNSKTLLYRAIQKGNVEFVKFLLTIPNLDVNKGYPLVEMTPLMAATDENEIEIVKLLLSHKDIDIIYTNRYGENAISIAQEYENLEILELLLATNI